MTLPKKTFYITTPIYYVNDKPHIGHAYTTLLADVLSRYHRLTGEETLFLTGTDDHGQKVEKAARALGRDPLAHCDAMVIHFQELWKMLDVSNDDFIRTTQQRHIDVVVKTLADLYAKDEIYRAEYEGWYCVPCERFFNEGDLQEGNCPECMRSVDRLTETNYFFRMSKYQQWLIDYIEANPEFIQPDLRRNETLGFLRKPLGDLCISRPKSRVSWGITLPFDPGYVCYVWFDALINYISGAGYLADNDKFAKWWPANYHLIGKDILTTHTVYWPTMLKAMGVAMPRTIFAHGWWLAEGDKMSKSKGNVIDPVALSNEFGVDAVRYFLMAEMTTGQDATFSRAKFIERYNGDLANNVGNLASRVIKMISANLGGIMPKPNNPQPIDEELKNAVMAIVGEVKQYIFDVKLNRAIESIIATIKLCNQYFEQTEPWKIKNDLSQRERLATILYTAAESLRIISGLLYPVMPQKMSALRAILGLGEPQEDELRQWNVLKQGQKVGTIDSLFPRFVVVDK